MGMNICRSERLVRLMMVCDATPAMMITHNMTDALELGNRTLMMDSGRIVLDIGGEERKGLTVDDLLMRFRTQGLDNDRILLWSSYNSVGQKSYLRAPMHVGYTTDEYKRFEKVIDLTFNRPYFNFGVKKSCRTNNLLYNNAF